MAKAYKEHYDIDLKVLKGKFQDLIRSSNSPTEERQIKTCVSRFMGELEIYVGDLGYDLQELDKKLVEVVPSAHNMYDLFLSHDMCFRASYSIPSYLDYHYDNFKGNHYARNKSDFLDVLKFNVCNRISHSHPGHNKKLPEQIIRWVREKEGVIKPHRLRIPSRKVIMNEEDIAVLVQILKPHFKRQSMEKLRRLLKGEDIPGKLIFKGNANQFCHAFLRLLETKKIQLKKEGLCEWIHHNFMYSNEKNEIKSFSKASMRNVISKAIYHCKNPLPGIVEWLGN